jgi:prepilin-type N-terminal cleavage/methylation domain-containing protein
MTLLRPSRRPAFSLLELLAVLALVVILAVVGLPAIASLSSGSHFTRNAYLLSETLQFARAKAMGENTYVWVGLLPQSAGDAGNVSGADRVVLLAVSARNGLASDLASGQVRAETRVRTLDRLRLGPIEASRLPAPGRETQDVDDLAASSLGAVTGTLGGKKLTFALLVQFDPRGGARIKSTASKWIEIGLQPVGEGARSNAGVIQINGLTGQSRLFRP